MTSSFLWVRNLGAARLVLTRDLSGSCSQAVSRGHSHQKAWLERRSRSQGGSLTGLLVGDPVLHPSIGLLRCSRRSASLSPPWVTQEKERESNHRKPPWFLWPSLWSGLFYRWWCYFGDSTMFGINGGDVVLKWWTTYSLVNFQTKYSFPLIYIELL